MADLHVWTDLILCWQPNMTSVLRSCDEFILIHVRYASEQPWLISSSKQPSDTYLTLLNTHTNVWYCPLLRCWSEVWRHWSCLFLWCLNGQFEVGWCLKERWEHLVAGLSRTLIVYYCSLWCAYWTLLAAYVVLKEDLWNSFLCSDWGNK